MEFRLKALTDIWTGGVEGETDKLHLTGIKGTLRWWDEVLIRGLGYYACDPTADDACNLDPKRLITNSPIPHPDQVKGMICPACYFFGCTGWSGKFNLRVKEYKGKKGKDDNVKIKTGGIKEDDCFTLEFVQRKNFDSEEKMLMTITLKLIVDYGAFAGKTTFKPSEIETKNRKFHHTDFGLIARADNSNIPTEKIDRNGIGKYLEGFTKNSSKNNSVWPDLQNFWFVKESYFNRRQINNIVERDNNGNYINSPSGLAVFLGGFISKDKGIFSSELSKDYKDIDSVSKKIFSFHGMREKNGKLIQAFLPRCFGYVEKNKLEEVIHLIKTKTQEAELWGIKRGEEVLNEL